MSTLDRSSRRALAGQRIILGFPGDRVDAELREVLREVQPAGVILFARNAESAAAARELNAELKSLCGGRPLLCSVDQEGGRVARIRAGVTPWPPMRQLGAQGDAALAEQVGAALGGELRAMGFDLDFAPVLDVDTNPANPVIGDRALAADPARVGSLGAALVRGLQGAGVAACGKHFPGHGDTALDSHLALPHIGHPLHRLQQVEWPPFAAAIAAGVSSIMSAHVVVEALDPQRPATLSARALAEPLRRDLGFGGIIVSDDIEMRALADHHAPAEVAGLGDRAGVDVFLACHHHPVTLELYRGLLQQLERASPDACDAAVAQGRRIGAWIGRFARPVPPAAALAQVAGCAAHRALLHRLAAPAAIA